MKRFIFAIVSCLASIVGHAECTTLTGTSVEISRWYDFYMPVVGEMECWTVELEGEGPYQIRYNIDLDQFECIDAVWIYEIEDNGTLRLIKTFSCITESGALITHSNRLRVEYYGYTGKLTEEYFDGFQLYFEKASHEYVAIHDYYVLGSLGIGTTNPQATLHVNGGIYGGESFGATKLQSSLGYITIGTSSTDHLNMQFTTDRDIFSFNKPIITNNSLTIKDAARTLEIGAIDEANNVYFTTNSFGYHFDKPFTLDTGLIVSKTPLSFYTNTNKCCMVMQNNGYIGIGTLNPKAKIHIEQGALRLGSSSGYISRQQHLIYFGDSLKVKIGEWENDNTLSFNANAFSFTGGNVGIGETNPEFKLDVTGTIRAQELIIETTGADFVFAEDYQLRPLSDVKAFIQEYKHLPEIKSAREMQESGIGVSELQTQLLQKIEELTLYLIQQEQTIQELQQEVEQLKK